VKIEFLVLVTNDDSFCNSKKAFIDFLKVDSLISITGQKLTYRRTPKSKALITVKFRVETDNIPSNKERYFLIALENTNDELVDEFSEVGNKIKQISKRINPESTVVNILWDDIGRHYAYKAYPLINDVENVMRKLISKFMLINVGMDWSKETIHPDLAKKIENFEEDDAHLNDLYKLDFINLSEVLFQKKRDISLDELDRVLLKTKFNDLDQTKILKYVPRSNWEKHFSSLLDEDSQGLEKKWELLYKLRNKVAHNRFLTKEDFGKIKGLTTQVKGILGIAMNKLGEIDLDEEDREQIIHFYQSESPAAIGYLAEKAVAEYYMQNGMEIYQPKSRHSTDFVIKTPQGHTAVEIKSYSIRSLVTSFRMRVSRALLHVERFMAMESIDNVEIILVIHDDVNEIRKPRFLKQLIDVRENLSPNIVIKLGGINEEGKFEPIDI